MVLDEPEPMLAMSCLVSTAGKIDIYKLNIWLMKKYVHFQEIIDESKSYKIQNASNGLQELSETWNNRAKLMVPWSKQVDNGDRLDPSGSTMRAEMAQVLYNLLSKQKMPKGGWF